MPTYEYTCKACGHDFERFESIVAKPNKLCPKCNKKKAERRISAGGGFLFKGSGFYVTDYRKTAAPANAEGKTDAKSSDAKPADAKPAETKSTDSKPADAKSADAKPASSESKGSKESKSDGGKSGKSSGKVA
jgi:putative FmdB family regulatory protein